MKDFSKKVLKHALGKGLSISDIESNYKQLLPDYYEYGNHVLFKDEIGDYMYDYRKELFYYEGKATFWLLIDFIMLESLHIIPVRTTQSVETSNEKIAENSDLSEIYLFIKNNLFHLEEAFYDKMIKKSINLSLEEGEYFVDSMWNQFSEYLKLSNATSEHIKSKLEEFYIFQDAFEEYCDENDYEY